MSFIAEVMNIISPAHAIPYVSCKSGFDPCGMPDHQLVIVLLTLKTVKNTYNYVCKLQILIPNIKSHKSLQLERSGKMDVYVSHLHPRFFFT